MTDLFPLAKTMATDLHGQLSADDPPLMRQLIAAFIVVAAPMLACVDVTLWPIRLFGACLLPLFDKARDKQDTRPVDSRERGHQ